MSTSQSQNLKLTYSHISNIQKFLNKFKKSQSTSLISPQIKSDLEVYSSSSEAFLPDLFLKTRTPIDRNKMFIYWEEKKKYRKGKGEGSPRKKRRNLGEGIREKEPVYFPM
jgi:hypothetical protein